MKKNGFTLIELLAAIIVLGIISLIVFPTIDRTIKNQKNKLYDRQVATIIDAGKSWGLKNTSLLPETGVMVYVGINKLAEDGFLENSDIKNPKNSELMNGCVTIRYNVNYKQYDYEFVDLANVTDTNCNKDKVCTLVNSTVTCN